MNKTMPSIRQPPKDSSEAGSRVAHLWSGRFEEEPDAALIEFGRSFGFDRRLFEDDVRGSVAWAGALERAGVLTSADAAAIKAGLEDVLSRGRDPAFFDSPPAARDEDVHSFVERELVARIGEAGRRLHTGRSRNEQVAVDLRLYLKRRLPELQASVVRLIRVLGESAQRTGDAVMPSYTHLRRAQPILAAHFFLAHASALRRDHARLAALADEADELPLGSGAIAGTSYTIDTAWLARTLGFSRVVRNSIDATGDRDVVASFLFAASLAMVHLSRLAEDMILFTSEEFGFFELADTAATGSSLMPQKKNPDPLELVRGKSGRVIGRLTGWLATMKGLPIGYSKDLQEDKEALFEAEDTLRASLAATGSVVSGISINRDAAARAASGLLLATDVADYLVAKGLPFRDAHEIVGAIVRRLVREGRSFDALTLDEWRSHSPLFESDIHLAITPAASIAKKRTPQSTHPDAVSKSLAELESWLSTAD
jgi:argininosuccinate lyase